VVLSGRTQVAAVIGDPVEHSLSPAILNAAFAAADLDWAYVAFTVAADDVARALEGVRSLGIRGLSVTMPHKEAVAALVDERSPEATLLGAVNCVVNDGGRLVGHNTDGAGFVDALRAEVGLELAGRRVVLVGAGGAARAIALALGQAGAADVAVVNRTQARAEVAASLVGAAGRVGSDADVAGADLVVNATPVGMLDAMVPIDPAALHRGQVVADIVYRPAITPLLAAAAASGAVAVNGLGMLVHQAAHALRLWTTVEPPLESMLAGALAQLD
jgi:shikimate dehydrogenase